MTSPSTPPARLGTFPFGELLLPVVQQDPGPKDVFVLGAYAGVVLAQWRDADGRTVFRTLPVAREPCPLWNGDGAAAIVGRIPIPPEAGSLAPAEGRFNGATGRALDDLFLGPLGLDRSRAWLCTLVPYFFPALDRARAIEERYLPAARRLGLPAPALPPVPYHLTDAARREAILDELRRSRAATMVTLGDQPAAVVRQALRPALESGSPTSAPRATPTGDTIASASTTSSSRSCPSPTQGRQPASASTRRPGPRGTRHEWGGIRRRGRIVRKKLDDLVLRGRLRMKSGQHGRCYVGVEKK